MPKFYKTAITNYNQQELFDLVADVAKYPEFLPFCTKTEVHESSSIHLIADMHIGYKNFAGTFRSKVLKEFPHKLIIEQTHGNLKHLRSLWIFHKNTPLMCKIGSTLQHSSTIEFMIDFEPSSWLVGKLITPLMEELGHTMMQSFLQRASTLYDGVSG